MAYNRKNKLLQMKHVLEVYNREKKDGVSTIYVYRTYIFPQFHISINTLYNILATPVQKLLKDDDQQALSKDKYIQTKINF